MVSPQSETWSSPDATILLAEAWVPHGERQAVTESRVWAKPHETTAGRQGYAYAVRRS